MENIELKVEGKKLILTVDLTKETPVLSWETGAGQSHLIPALEVGGFIFGLNQFNRHFVDPTRDYETDADTFWKNLRTTPVYDKDPFSVNQIGHPYQGGIYYDFARSAGLSYSASRRPPSGPAWATRLVGGSRFGICRRRLGQELFPEK
jgi:hypothetical protein